MTVLSTERLVLREWTADPADLARIFDIYSRRTRRSVLRTVMAGDPNE